MKEFTIDLKTYREALNLALGWKRYYLIYLSIFLILISLMRIPLENGLSQVDLQLPLTFGGMLLLSILITLYQNHLFTKNYRTHKALQETHRMSFDENRIRGESDSGSFSRDWADLIKYKTGKNLILVFETRQLFRMIPRSAFESPEEYERFLSHLEKIKEIRKKS